MFATVIIIFMLERDAFKDNYFAISEDLAYFSNLNEFVFKFFRIFHFVNLCPLHHSFVYFVAIDCLKFSLLTAYCNVHQSRSKISKIRRIPKKCANQNGRPSRSLKSKRKHTQSKKTPQTTEKTEKQRKKIFRSRN